MTIEIINKVLYVLFFLSILNIVRCTFFLIGSFIKSNDVRPEKYRLNRLSLILLGLSIGYVISVFFTGVTIS
jgi:hypothetical protein